MKSALFSPLWAIVLAIGLVIVLAARVQAASPHSASTAIAGDLTTMMSAQHLDALAAQDPQHPDFTPLGRRVKCPSYLPWIIFSRSRLYSSSLIAPVS